MKNTLYTTCTQNCNPSRLLYITVYIGLYTYDNTDAVVGVLCSCCRYEVRPISDLLQEPLRSAFDKATKAYLAAKDAAWKKVNKCPKSCGNSKGFHGTCVGDRCKCPTGANQKFAGSGCTCAPGYSNNPNGES